MVVSSFRSKVVFLDTSPLIYFIEGHSIYQNVLKKLFEANDNGAFTFITTTITLMEVLVQPMRLHKNDLAEKYRDILLNASGIEVHDITAEVAIKAAELRGEFNLKTPDALQLATAIYYQADYFLTNDTRLKNIAGIHVITVPEIE